MYSSSLYPFSSIPSSDSSADRQTNREKYFYLVRQIRDYLGDEKVDYPGDLVYCFESKDFRSESKIQQGGTVSKFIRHQPFQEFIQMLKRSAKLLATDTGEETEQLTKEQEKELEGYLTKNQPWELTGEQWIQKRRYGAKKKEEIIEYKAFLQKISKQTRLLDMSIARWRKESEEKETTQETKTINKHITDHALWLQKELEELPLEERYSLTVPIERFFAQQRAIRFNPFLQIGLAKEQAILEELVKENNEDKEIPKLIKRCQVLRQMSEKLVKDILTGGRSIEDVNVLDKAIRELLEDIRAMHAKILVFKFKELIAEQSHRLDQLINSLQVVEDNATAEKSALKKRIIRYAKFIQNEFLANIPFAKRESVLPVIDAFFKRQQQTSSPCFQFAFSEVEMTLEKLARQSKNERSAIMLLLAKCKELSGMRKTLLCRILPEDNEFDFLVTETEDVSGFSKGVAELARDLDQLQSLREEKYQETRSVSVERMMQTGEQNSSWWSSPLSWVGRGQVTVGGPLKMEPAKKEKVYEFKKK